jgi:MFS transporter, PPP family, 3-phenylpropionic acid transporter
MQSTVPAPRYYALRIAAFFGGYFVLGGVALPFFPVWLEARGLTDTEIASLVAIPMALRVLLTPLAGMFADRAPNRRFAIRIFTVASLGIFLLAWPATSYWPLLITTGTAMVIYQVSLPVGEALALTGVRQFGLDYGRMRFAGSLTFIITNLAAGAVIGLVTSEAIYWMMVAGLVAGAGVSFTLPVTPRKARALDDAERPDVRPAREVLGNPALLALLAASGLVQASHGVLYSFGSLHWQSLGFSGVEIGMLWAIGVVCEIGLFLWSGAVVRRTGDFGLLLIGTVGAILRWSLFPLDLGFAGFLLVQCLHGLSFGATYLGVQHAIARIVPDEMTASAQGIYAMMTGILMAGITALSGPLYSNLGHLAFVTMTIPPALAILALFAYRRLAAI